MNTTVTKESPMEPTSPGTDQQQEWNAFHALDAAANLLTAGRWCRGTHASAMGMPCDPWDPCADRWDLQGAVMKVLTDRLGTTTTTNFDARGNEIIRITLSSPAAELFADCIGHLRSAVPVMKLVSRGRGGKSRETIYIQSLSEFNDDPSRTREQVVELLVAARAKAYEHMLNNAQAQLL